MRGRAAVFVLRSLPVRAKVAARSCPVGARGCPTGSAAGFRCSRRWSGCRCSRAHAAGCRRVLERACPAPTPTCATARGRAAPSAVSAPGTRSENRGAPAASAKTLRVSPTLVGRRSTRWNVLPSSPSGERCDRWQPRRNPPEPVDRAAVDPGQRNDRRQRSRETFETGTGSKGLDLVHPARDRVADDERGPVDAPRDRHSPRTTSSESCLVRKYGSSSPTPPRTCPPGICPGNDPPRRSSSRGGTRRADRHGRGDRFAVPDR